MKLSLLAVLALAALAAAPGAAFAEEPGPAPADPPKDPAPGEAKPDPAPGGPPEAAPGEGPAEPKPDPKPEAPPPAPVEDKGITRAGADRYTLSIAGRRADAALKELFEASSRALPLDLGPEAPPVTLALEGAPYWQCVDAIAREAKAYVWGAFGAPRVRSLPAAAADRAPFAAYSGTLRLSLESVETRRDLTPAGAAEAPLELLAWGLPEPGTRVFTAAGFGPSPGAAALVVRDSAGTELPVLDARLVPVGDGFRLSAR
ncbi:MAG: hypothetical protein MUC63_09705, partial [Planctomycetes bacterium]|nr:hypothetical protein [Planctomycetota bacterium]